MMVPNADESDACKRRYQNVLSTINPNTSGFDHRLPAGIRLKHHNVILADQADHDVEAIGSTLKMVIGEQNVSDDPDHDLIRHAAAAREEVRV